MNFARLCSRLAACALAAALAASAQTAAGPARAVALANPASKNCVAKGGSLTIEKNGAGGQFGVCSFADNLQCEEWALMRGDCRDGGIKVTGFVTPAARYCAITGGAYTVTAGSNTAAEQGRCTFGSGKSCTAAAYFDGSCTRQANATAAAAATTVRATFTCDADKTVAAVFTNGAQSSVALVLSDGRRLSLPQALSGSGARYANADDSFVFWNKGYTAFIAEHGKPSYSGCTTPR